MTERAKIAVGDWFRFDGYQIRDGCISPAEGAALVRYDPWQDYEIGADKRRLQNPPYLSLVKLLDETDLVAAYQDRMSQLSATDEAAVLDWCGDHGLLGLLLHRTQKICLEPRWEPSPLLELSGRLVPAAIAYVRTSDGWIATLQTLDHAAYDPSADRGQVICRDDMRKGWPHAAVWMTGGVGSTDDTVRREVLSTTWSRFFPTVPIGEWETFRYPTPRSGAFWRLYAEPVSGFIRAAMELAVVLNLLSQPKPAVKSTIDQQALARAGIDRLHRLTNRVTPAIEYQPDGSYLQYWPTHSLFETYAMMALLDVSVRRRTLSCEECGAPFVTDSPRARYCGSTCRYRFQKRRQRASAASDHREV